MLTIRLQRTGRKNDAKFRMVVTNSTNGPKSGKFLEVIGFYDPKEGKIGYQKERASYWMSQGAQVSDTVRNFMIHDGFVEGRKKNVLPKKSITTKKKKK